MVNAQEALSYVQNNTNLADEVGVASEGEGAAILEGTRTKADGTKQAVTIDIRDSGAGAGDYRYAVTVSAEGADPTVANEAATLTDAISNADARSSGLG